MVKTTPRLTDVLWLGVSLAFAFGSGLLLIPLDLYPTWVAGRLLQAGDMASIYQPGLWLHSNLPSSWGDLLKEAGLTNEGTVFTYHPVYLWLTYPLTIALPFKTFAAIASLISGASAFFIGIETCRFIGAADTKTRSKIIGAAVLGLTTIYSIMIGQNILPTVALLLLSFRLAGNATGTLRSAAIAAFALAAFAKPWAILSLPAFAAAGGMGLAGIVLVVVGVLFFLPMLIAPELFQSYGVMLDALARHTLLAGNNVSLTAFLCRLSDSGHLAAIASKPMPILTPIWIAQSTKVASFGLIAWTWWQLRTTAPRPALITGLLALAVLPLSVSWTHYFLLVIPFAAVLSFHQDIHRTARWIGKTLLVVLVLLPPLMAWPSPKTYPWLNDWPVLVAWWLMVPNLLLIGAVLALGFPKNLPGKGSRELSP